MAPAPNRSWITLLQHPLLVAAVVIATVGLTFYLVGQWSDSMLWETAR
jgi:hypothetical protein